MTNVTKQAKPATLFAVLMLFVLISPAAHAEDNAWTKLGRGMNNIVMAPLEPFFQFEEINKTKSVGIAAFAAIPQGIVYGGKRLGVGLYDVFTFPFKPYDKVLMQPEDRLPKS